MQRDRVTFSYRKSDLLIQKFIFVRFLKIFVQNRGFDRGIVEGLKTIPSTNNPLKNNILQQR